MNQAKLDTIHDLMAEVERLQKDKYRLQKALNQSEDYRIIAETKAYKEFAERLKAKNAENKYILPSVNLNIDDTLNKLLSNDMGRYDHYTDSFVKELTEDNK